MLISILSWLLALLFLLAVLGIACLVLATLWIAAKARKTGAAGRKIRRDRRQPHPLCRCGRGQADRLPARAWCATPSFPPHAVRTFRPGLPADRARSAGIGLFGARQRCHRPVARTGGPGAPLHRKTGAGKAAGGRPFAGWRHRADPGRGTSRGDFGHRLAGAADASGNQDTPAVRPALYSLAPAALDHGLHGGDTDEPAICAADDGIHLRAAGVSRATTWSTAVAGSGCGQAISTRPRPMSWRSNRISAASSSAMARLPCRPASSSERADRVIDIRIHGEPMRGKIEGLDFERVDGARPYAAVRRAGAGDRFHRADCRPRVSRSDHHSLTTISMNQSG